jgi:ribose-phosphate pyrophosphokinase
MITLNLVNQEKSQIKYRISRFPDGQQTVDLTDWNDLMIYEDPVKISSRLNSFKDLELIICSVAAIRNIKPNREIALHVPYFMGARSDRKFADGGINYLKQVICPIINSLKLDSIIVLDPHSDVLEACLNNYEKIDNHLIVKHALTKIDNKNNAQERICLVSPDAGAYKKIFDVAKKFGIQNVVTANKVRDMKTGNILKTEVPNLPSSTGDPNSVNDGMKYVIVDDICDGGRTFIELAKAIKKERISAKIYLVVTHGIFSAGLKELNQHFEGIFTTNSYVDENDAEFSIKNDNEMNKLTQFNVF